MAIRPNTQGSYGIFDNILDLKQIMLYTYELNIEYGIIVELPPEATPIHT
jgi:hypothetical protein